MILDEEKGLRDRLSTLKREHRHLDDAIFGLADGVSADQLQMQRMKKQKLALRDEISRLEDELYPDIIA